MFIHMLQAAILFAGPCILPGHFPAHSTPAPFTFFTRVIFSHFRDPLRPGGIPVGPVPELSGKADRGLPHLFKSNRAG
jgi:hypothetical protein